MSPVPLRPETPWPLHPTLTALLPRLQLVQDCWHLLAGRREHYLPRGEREPESAYRRRVDAALPSGFFRDALRTFAGMLASSHWRELPASLQAVISDVDGCGTDLEVLEASDLLVLRDGAALVGVIPRPTSGPARGTGSRPCATVIACRCRGCCCLSVATFSTGTSPATMRCRMRSPGASGTPMPSPRPPTHRRHRIHRRILWQYLTASLVADGPEALAWP